MVEREPHDAGAESGAEPGAATPSFDRRRDLPPVPEDRRGGTLLLLAGAEVWPNYFAVCALRPRRVVLMASHFTAEPARRLCEVLEDQRGVEVYRPEPVADAFHPAVVYDWLLNSLHALGERWSLVYTGGTSVMSVQSALAHKEAHHGMHDAGVVSRAALDFDGRLIFDDGIEAALFDPSSPPPLSREVVQTLTGACFVREEPNEAQGIPRPALCNVRNARLLCETGPELVRRADSDSDEAFQRIRRIMRRYPDRNWAKILRADWLEQLTQVTLRRAANGMPAEILANYHVRFGRAESQEIDTVVFAGERLHVVSCTTVTGKKSRQEIVRKIDQVSLQARQLGGIAARPALVFLGTPDDVESDLRHYASSRWRSPGEFAFFTRDDADSWCAQRPDCERLTRWLRGDSPDPI